MKSYKQILLLLSCIMFACGHTVNQEMKKIQITIARGLDCGTSYEIDMQKNNMQVKYRNAEISNSYSIPIDKPTFDSISHYTYDIVNSIKKKENEGGYMDGLFFHINYINVNNNRDSVTFEKYDPNDRSYKDLHNINSNIPKLILMLKFIDKENKCL